MPAFAIANLAVMGVLFGYLTAVADDESKHAQVVGLAVLITLLNAIGCVLILLHHHG